jgi:SAM-dependent methyltransferase
VKPPAFRARQRRHFDEQVRAYRELYGRESAFHDHHTERLLALAVPGGAERVLDLGCGFGRVTLPLLARGHRVVGLDLSRPTLQALQERVHQLGADERFEARCASAEELDDAQAFDRVVGRGLLHHLEDPARVLGRVTRALRPGGTATFMDPNPLQPAWIALVLAHPALSVRIERNLWRLTPRRTLRLLREAGLGRTLLDYSGFLPPLPRGWAQRLAGLESGLEGLPWVRALAMYQLVRGERAA